MACIGIKCCGGGIQTPCCAPTIPKVLHAVVTFPGCPAIGGTFELDWNGTSWVYPVDANGLSIGLQCIVATNQFILNLQCPQGRGFYYLNTPPTSVDCGPPIVIHFPASVAVTNPPGCCAGTITSVVIMP